MCVLLFFFGVVEESPPGGSTGFVSVPAGGGNSDFFGSGRGCGGFGLSSPPGLIPEELSLPPETGDVGAGEELFLLAVPVPPALGSRESRFLPLSSSCLSCGL